MLEAQSDNIDGIISSSLINLSHYFAECYEDEFILATGDSGLTFLVKCLLLKLQV